MVMFYMCMLNQYLFTMLSLKTLLREKTGENYKTIFLLLERLRFTFTANGKRQTQVEDLSD